MNRSLLTAALLGAFATAAHAAPATLAESFHACRTATGDTALAACTAYLAAPPSAITPAQLALVHMLRAQAYIETHKLPQALADYEAATHADPSNADAWYSHAVVAGGLNKLDTAIADLDRAIALRPRWAQAYVTRGATHLAHGEPQKTIEDDTKALSLDANNPQAKSDLALAQQRLGQRAP